LGSVNGRFFSRQYGRDLFPAKNRLLIDPHRAGKWEGNSHGIAQRARQRYPVLGARGDGWSRWD
jgi:hypothetical protein